MSETGGRVEPYDWASRAGGMPFLPGPGSEQVKVLAEVLDLVVVHGGAGGALVSLWHDKQVPLRKVARPLLVTGMLEQSGPDRFVLSAHGEEWLAERDVWLLLSGLHRRVRFIGELLSLLETPRKTQELLDAAVGTYHLAWKTKQELQRRLAWFMSMGLVEQSTSVTYGLTELGHDLVTRLVPGGPDLAPEAPSNEAVLLVVPEEISALLERGFKRRTPLGFVPTKGVGTPVEALQILANACSPEIGREDLLSFMKDRFGLKESSTGAALTTLTTAGLIEETKVKVFSPTLAGSAWLADPKPVNLALILHARFTFVLEIIPLLQQEGRTSGQLSQAAAESYGLTLNQNAVNKRLAFLKEAGLTFPKNSRVHMATPLGVALAARWLRDEVAPQVPLTVEPEAATGGRAELIAVEVEAAATASDDHVRLEEAMSEALRYLGFETEHISGPGETDVLARTTRADGRAVTITVDAKTNGAGRISERAVQFPALKEHQRREGADHAAVVAPGFQGRLPEWAAEQGVALLSARTLANAVREHERAPLPSYEYLPLLTDGDNGDTALTTARHDGWLRHVQVLNAVIGALSTEARLEAEGAEETEYAGALTLMLLKRDIRRDASPSPDTKEVQEALAFLSSPFLGIVQEEKKAGELTYRITGSPALLAQKLLALSCEAA